MRFKKTDLKGNLREFSSDILSDFVHDKDDIEFFTSAEVLAMTRYEINNLRASIQQFLPVSKIRLFEGQSVGMLRGLIINFYFIYLFICSFPLVEKLMHKNLITQLYPLHEPEPLKRLCRDWWEGFNCLSAHDQPLGKLIKILFPENHNEFLRYQIESATILVRASPSILPSCAL